ncbi:hypothetical protein NMY22_g16531 [Coprinellus aureogranulatus]|nr:hypothetical protein NMY22_g16531 [Coprinellus aureogranulatus]
MSHSSFPSAHHPPEAQTTSTPFPDVSPLVSSTENPDNECDTLWRAIYALGRNVDSFVGRQEVEAEAGRRALDAIVQRLTEIGSSSSRNVGVPKFREPRMFTGAADQVDGFLCEIENALYLQRNSFTTDRNRVVYFSLYLGDGSPGSWYCTVEIRNRETGLLDNYPAFVTTFRKHFETPDLYADALQKLQDLTQTDSAATFTSRFEELSARLDWTDQTKIEEYWRRLKESVQDTLVNRRGRYFTQRFDEFSRECISIDNELTQLRLNRQSRSSTFLPSSSHVSHRLPPLDQTPTSSASNDVVPMEIDAITKAPLSVEEKARRRRLDLCFSCGKGKHHAADCPHRLSL